MREKHKKKHEIIFEENDIETELFDRMDVLELPRPVINFLRTMAKESCRYTLSWDIFGGPDSVTLTLTWKLIDEETPSSIIHETTSPLSTLKQPTATGNYDDPSIRPRSSVKSSHITSTSSPRRSRRDDNNPSLNENASVPAIFRSSRGKSLEGSSLQSSKSIPSHLIHSKEPQHISTLERTTFTNHQQHSRSKRNQAKISSDQTYGNLYDTRSASVVKCATISSLSSSSPSPQPTTNNPPLSSAHTHHQRAKQRQQRPITPPTVRKPTRPPSNYPTLRRTNNVPRQDNAEEDDDGLDPWVKRFECSLEDNDDDGDGDDDETTERSESKDLSLPLTTLPSNPTDDSTNTSGKVKFKTKPDYF